MRRKKGSGSISYDKIRNQYIASLRHTSGKKKQKRFNTKQEAEDWIITTKAQILEGSYIDIDTTFYQWGIKVLSFKKNTIKTQTYNNYKSAFKHFKPLWPRKLKEIKAIELDQFLQTHPTSKTQHTLLTMIFKLAVKYELIIKAPSISYHRKPQQDRQRIFTPQEVATISQHLKTRPKYYLVFLTMLNTGMRVGEVLALTYEDVDTNKATITINKNLAFATGTMGTPKTQSSYRTIKIPQGLNNEFKKLKAQQTNIRYTKELIFKSRVGKPVTYITLCKHLNTMLKKLKISKHTCHDFRHTHASQLLNAGVPITDIAKRLGHASPAITLKTYSHVIDQQEEKVIDAIENNISLGW